MEEFKELNIDKSRLEDEVKKYFSTHGVTKHVFSEQNKFRRLEYLVGKDKVMIDFYFLQNGTTTIKYKVGSHQELGKELASYLYNELNFDERKNLYQKIKDFKKEDFENLKEYFQEVNEDGTEKYTISESKNDDTQISINIKCNQYSDCVAITFYKTTTTLLIQGKPLYTFSQLTYFLSEYTDLDGFLSITTKLAPEQIVEIIKEEVKYTLEKNLTNAMPFLGENLKKMMMTSLSINSASLELPDYAVIVYPALRALEGFLKSILFKIGIGVSKDGFSKVFTPDRGDFIISKAVESLIDRNMWAPLCSSYKYFFIHRNRLFHTDDFVDSSRMIEDKAEASKMVNTIMKIIDETYFKIATYIR